MNALWPGLMKFMDVISEWSYEWFMAINRWFSEFMIDLPSSSWDFGGGYDWVSSVYGV